jgi:toxin CcdB
MARFAVYRLASSEFVLDCQADLLGFLETRFVVPLLDLAAVPTPVHRLHPVFAVAGLELVMANHLATAIDRHELEGPVATLEHEGYAISNALDMLISGF